MEKVKHVARHVSMWQVAAFAARDAVSHAARCRIISRDYVGQTFDVQQRHVQRQAPIFSFVDYGDIPDSDDQSTAMSGGRGIGAHRVQEAVKMRHETELSGGGHGKDSLVVTQTRG